MTDFQMSLIAAGGVFVVGVITYNKWQEHKARKSVERAFASDHDDVLMRSSGADRSEPVLDVGMPGLEAAEPSFGTAPDAPEASGAVTAPSGAASGAASGATSGATSGTGFGSADPLAPLAGSSAPAAPAVPLDAAENLVDPLIDCIIPLALEAPGRGERMLPALLKLRRVGNKPIHYIGLAVGGDWAPIVHGGVYTKLQAGVQMATRTTALNELEYSELVTRLRAVADEIGAEPEVPDMIEVMSDARTLHKFVAGHDAQLGVNLRSNAAPWPMSTLIGALENAGFDVRPDGRFAMLDEAGGVLFTLSTNVTLGADSTDRLTLLLDVPCVAPSRDGFGAMLKCARDLMLRLDATIVDDYEQPLMDAALDEIAGQVKDFYAEMETADIPAGSPRALRLFS
ncbi:cell division protein ZipA C-terminal FtsZ-binding domain-containing protein [Massilia sp. Se16.2.3]|uniref:cell division protein ZipA C-terminal FtsZ-binding domain-containing protein n=1 Tax=Massilia sp. Se16.2.3 TaxID=2709303 RepID=UPI00160371D1|nr:cell division protein ZipA C-terminal FtsZ-binding domain-containing protein [Massilia sp. Se16.2.3]QNB00271.1 cell division protein [Massilia sp. Se16.2.3]